MKKFFYIHFIFHYIVMMFIYLVQPVLILLNELISLEISDIVIFNELITYSVGIILCIQYVFVIIPTVKIFNLDEDIEYHVFSRKKVYGVSRKIILTNVLIFIIIECIICVIRIVRNVEIFIGFFWMPIVSFALLSGVVALMSGVFLELKKKKTRIKI